MAWGRLDDKLYSHRKTMRIPRARRCEAMGLWTLAMSWANNHGTDGYVPRDIWDEFGTTEDMADLLVEAGWWIATEEGYLIANFAEYNLTSEDAQAKREAEAKRKRQWRDAKRSRSDTSPANVPVGQGDMSHPVPSSSEPVPPDSVTTQSHTHTHKENSSTKSSSSSAKPPTTREPPRPDVDALCVRLRDQIVANDNRAPVITDKWRTEARLLLDKDGVPLDKALNLIDWCQADSFWRSNVMSMAKFREKYDQLRLKALEEHRRSTPGTAPVTSRTDRKLQAIFEAGARTLDNPNSPKELTT